MVQSGSPLCLACHTYAHLPNTDVSGQECQSCHAVPPEDPSAFWSDAPGQHDECELCHDLLAWDSPTPYAFLGTPPDDDPEKAMYWAAQAALLGAGGGRESGLSPHPAP